MARESWLLYGANGYTGELIARLAAERGKAPVLAGRRREALEPLARELGLEWRAFPLDDPNALDAGLEGARAVLHCAGPFVRTSRPMAEACLRRRVHYLDITGEIEVFEALAARDAEARAAGVMLLPGSGYDVVPSDCLAAHLKSQLPTATRLTLAFTTSGRASHGTQMTVVENLHRGGVVRRQGRLTRVPPAWKTRRFDFGNGSRLAVTIPWGDVATAFHSTGIPEIEVYMGMPPRLIRGLRLLRPFLPLLRSRALRSLVQSRIPGGGPSAQERERAECRLYGEVEDGNGARAASRMRTPEGYTITAHAALAAVERTLEGGAQPGFQTPSRAFGADFVLSLPGVVREDL